MKKKLCLSLLLLVLASFTLAPPSSPGTGLSAFQKKLDSLQLKFTPAPGFREVRPGTGAGSDCAIAFRNKKRGIETRYYLYAFTPHQHGGKCAGNGLCLVPEPEKYFKEQIHSKIAMLSATEHYEVQKLNKVRQNEDLHADEAGFSTFPLRPGLGYSTATVVHLQKEKTGGAIVICLYEKPLPREQDVPLIEAGLSFR